MAPHRQRMADHAIAGVRGPLVERKARTSKVVEGPCGVTGVDDHIREIHGLATVALSTHNCRREELDAGLVTTLARAHGLETTHQSEVCITLNQALLAQLPGWLVGESDRSAQRLRQVGDQIGVIRPRIVRRQRREHEGL